MRSFYDKLIEFVILGLFRCEFVVIIIFICYFIGKWRRFLLKGKNLSNILVY